MVCSCLREKSHRLTNIYLIGFLSSLSRSMKWIDIHFLTKLLLFVLFYYQYPDSSAHWHGAWNGLKTKRYGDYLRICYTPHWMHKSPRKIHCLSRKVWPINSTLFFPFNNLSASFSTEPIPLIESNFRGWHARRFHFRQFNERHSVPQ